MLTDADLLKKICIKSCIKQFNQCCSRWKCSTTIRLRWDIYNDIGIGETILYRIFCCHEIKMTFFYLLKCMLYVCWKYIWSDVLDVGFKFLYCNLKFVLVVLLEFNWRHVFFFRNIYIEKKPRNLHCSVYELPDFYENLSKLISEIILLWIIKLKI